MNSMLSSFSNDGFNNTTYDVADLNLESETAFDSDSQRTNLHIAVWISGSFGIAGSLLIIIGSLFIPPKYKTPFATLIYFLAWSNLFSACSWVLIDPNGEYDVLCLIQAIGIEYFDIASFLWTNCIALVIFFNRNKSTWSIRYPGIHFVCWSVPSFCCVGAYFAKALGRTRGDWCWVITENGHYKAVFYGITFATLIVVGSVYISLFSNIKAPEEEELISLREKKQRSQLRRSFMLFVLSFLFSQVFAMINRFQMLVNPDNPVYTLYLLQALTQPAQGLFNTMVYGSVVMKGILEERRMSGRASATKDEAFWTY